MAERSIASLVPADFAVPETVELAGVTLKPLGLDDLVPDFEAVIESRERLVGLFSPEDTWPTGLTLHQDAVDLGWHEKEFQRRTSFAWGLWRGADYLGSSYLIPDGSGELDVMAVHWIKSTAVTETEPAFARAWRAWVEEAWPFARIGFASPEERT